MNKLAQFSSRPVGIRILAISGLFLFGTVALAAVVAETSVTGQSTDITYTQLSLAKPTDAVTGDLLLAAISIKNGSTGVITAPSGWTLINRADNSTNVGLATYYHVVGATEPGSYAWNISAPTHASGGITRYTGVAAASPIDALGSATGHSLAPTAPSVTTTHSEDQIVTVFTIRGGDNTPHFATPTGMTERYDTGYNPNGPSLALDDKTQSTAGASGTFTSSIPNGITRDWVAQTIALQASGGVLFSDDFTRADNPTVVGNGWSQHSAGSNTSEGISGNRYTALESDFGNSFIYRSDISQSSGIKITTKFTVSDLNNFFIVASKVRASIPSNTNEDGYGATLNCHDTTPGTLSIVDESTILATSTVTCVDGGNYVMELDISSAPQNWVDVYLWDESTSSRPGTPTVSFHNGSANYTSSANGSYFTWDPRSGNMSGNSVFSGSLYQVESI